MLTKKVMEDISEENFLQKFKAYDDELGFEGYYISSEVKIIDVSKIVGTFKSSFSSSYNDLGLGFMYEAGANKMETVWKYESLQKYKEFLLEDCVSGLPELMEYKNEYYIDGNGNHRLMLAKLLGISKAKVILKTLNESGQDLLKKYDL